MCAARDAAPAESVSPFPCCRIFFPSSLFGVGEAGLSYGGILAIRREGDIYSVYVVFCVNENQARGVVMS